MTGLGRCLTILAAVLICTGLEPGGERSGAGQKVKPVFPERKPHLGGGPIKHQHSVKYDEGVLKGSNVPEVTTDNKNTLVMKYPGKLLLSASSIWEQWPEDLAFDGNPHSSWFTAKGDAAAHGTKPWIQVTFPEDVTVKRVTILGNRDPRWLKGFTILAGTIELLDANGKRVGHHENDGSGMAYDYDWQLKEPVARVRSVRFNALGDQGKQNQYDDIAISEVQIE